MKKFMIMAAFAATTLTLFSCSKEKETEKGKEKENLVSIANTSWTYQQGKETEVVKFLSETAVNISTNYADSIKLTFDGTYQYDNPDVTINILGEIIRGTINSDSMVLKDVYLQKKTYYKD